MKGHRQYADLISLPLFFMARKYAINNQFCQNKIISNAKRRRGLTKTNTHTHTHVHDQG